MVQACITMELSQQEQGYSEITGNGRVHTMTISDYIRLALVIIHKYMYTDNFKERPVPRRRLGWWSLDTKRKRSRYLIGLVWLADRVQKWSTKITTLAKFTCDFFKAILRCGRPCHQQLPWLVHPSHWVRQPPSSRRKRRPETSGFSRGDPRAWMIALGSPETRLRAVLV